MMYVYVEVFDVFFFPIFAVQSMIFRLVLPTEVVLSEFPEKWLKNVQVTWKIVAHRRIAILTRYVIFLPNDLIRVGLIFLSLYFQVTEVLVKTCCLDE